MADGAPHRHLLRQLRKLGLSESSPPSPETWKLFLARVDRTYQDTDLERYTLEHSVTLVEREMRSLNGALETERDRMRLIFQAAPMAMMRIEIDQRITMVNPALLRLLGHREEDLLGSNMVDLVHPDHRTAASKSLAALRGGQLDSYTGQRHFLHKNGATIVTNISVSLARAPDGNPLFAIGVIEDISERTRLEIDLRHAQKLESVGRLAAGIAHEINTPIQFIGDNTAFLQSAFTDLMQVCDAYGSALERLHGVLSAEEVAVLRQVEESADLAYVREHAGSAFAATLDGVSRVATIVKAMKAFGHPDQGHKALADINAAIRNTLTVGGNELKYVADVETDFGELAPVECHLGDLNQVFLNLLINAAHAIADVVGDRGVKGKIRVRTRRENDMVVVTVSDTGTGIPESVRHRIFDPFFTTKEVGRGAGQGLAISRSVVEKHGGTLTFETETGKGTTFFVRLPAGPAVTRGEDGPAPAEGESPRRARG